MLDAEKGANSFKVHLITGKPLALVPQSEKEEVTTRISARPSSAPPRGHPALLAQHAAAAAGGGAHHLQYAAYAAAHHQQQHHNHQYQQQASEGQALPHMAPPLTALRRTHMNMQRPASAGPVPSASLYDRSQEGPAPSNFLSHGHDMYNMGAPLPPSHYVMYAHQGSIGHYSGAGAVAGTQDDSGLNLNSLNAIPTPPRMGLRSPGVAAASMPSPFGRSQWSGGHGGHGGSLLDLGSPAGAGTFMSSPLRFQTGASHHGANGTMPPPSVWAGHGTMQHGSGSAASFFSTGTVAKAAHGGGRQGRRGSRDVVLNDSTSGPALKVAKRGSSPAGNGYGSPRHVTAHALQTPALHRQLRTPLRDGNGMGTPLMLQTPASAGGKENRSARRRGNVMIIPDELGLRQLAHDELDFDGLPPSSPQQLHGQHQHDLLQPPAMHGMTPAHARLPMFNTGLTPAHLGGLGLSPGRAFEGLLSTASAKRHGRRDDSGIADSLGASPFGATHGMGWMSGTMGSPTSAWMISPFRPVSRGSVPLAMPISPA
jgi:hypothetical protein